MFRRLLDWLDLRLISPDWKPTAPLTYPNAANYALCEVRCAACGYRCGFHHRWHDGTMFCYDSGCTAFRDPY